MNSKNQLQKQLTHIINAVFDTAVPFSVSVPESTDHGDYSTNAALILAKPLGKSPREIAGKIQQELEQVKDELGIERVEIAGAGFVNIFMSQNTILSVMTEIDEKKDAFGLTDTLSGTKVITEFTDPNPFKEFHIGHLYSNTVGEALSRLIESQGAEVKRVCYQGDIGLHVAKALWGFLKKQKEQDLSLEHIEQMPLKQRAQFLGQSYALGATAYEEDEHAKNEIIEINKKIFAKDPQLMETYDKGKAWSLEYFNEMYSRLGMQFDAFFMESEVGEDGRKLVLGYLEKGVFEESEGAVIFPGEKYGLHNRVFINSLGLPTYEAKELGLAPAKYEYFPYDRSIVITGNEINEYFKVLLKALSLIRPELAEKTLHISHGMVRLPEGKMSSRTGNVLTGEWLLDEARQLALKKIEESGISKQQFDSAERKEIAEKVGVAAVKYALLKNGIGGDISFSFEESISFEGNAGPYLQYTYVRTQSVLEKGSQQSGTSDLGTGAITREEELVLRHLLHFSEIIEFVATMYAPNILCEYLYQLAQKFNVFYAKHKIIGGEQESFRQALTSAVGQTIKNGLTLLAIPIVDRM